MIIFIITIFSDLLLIIHPILYCNLMVNVKYMTDLNVEQHLF